MLILGKDTMKDPSLGYARTFVRQLEDCLGLALEQGVKIVSNAGGLNPAGLADRIREVAKGLGLDPAVAHVEGDDLRPLGLYDGALTANAYLGGFGIAAALTAGADVVVTGRVTDASVVVGPAVAHHGWTPTSYDELAGAVVAGHVIECGAQATGGNFSGFRRLVKDGMDPAKPLGFPIAEIAADGSSVITKHDGTGGAVTVDTVTAQLVYEIQSTRYLNPDVTTRPRHRSGSSRRARTGSRSPASAARRRPSGSRSASTSSAASATRSSSCSPASTSRRRPSGSASQLTPSLTADGRHLVAGRPAAAGRRHRGGRLGAAPLHGDGPAARPGRPRVHRPGGRARARVVPRLHDDHAAAAADAVRRLPARVRRPRAGPAHGGARRRAPRGGRRPDRVLDRRPRRGPPRRRRTPRRPTRSTAGCRSAPSCTPAPATRAATPTSASGSPTTATPAARPGSPGWPS